MAQVGHAAGAVHPRDHAGRGEGGAEVDGLQGDRQHLRTPPAAGEPGPGGELGFDDLGTPSDTSILTQSASQGASPTSLTGLLSAHMCKSLLAPPVVCCGMSVL